MIVADDEGWLLWSPDEIATTIYPYAAWPERRHELERRAPLLVDADLLVIEPCGCAFLPSLKAQHAVKSGRQTSPIQAWHQSHGARPGMPRNAAEPSGSGSDSSTGSDSDSGRAANGNGSTSLADAMLAGGGYAAELAAGRTSGSSPSTKERDRVRREPVEDGKHLDGPDDPVDDAPSRNRTALVPDPVTA